MTVQPSSPLSCRGLTVGYPRGFARAIPDIAFEPGAITLVTGANGSGKTTLLKTLAGLLPPVAGSLGAPRARGRGGVVFVQSTPYLFSGTVRHNLALSAATPARLTKMADQFGIVDWIDQTVATLSHGQRQRTALARALLCAPTVLLVDEPEGGLDTDALEAWRRSVSDALEDGALAVVMAAHHPIAGAGLPVRVLSLEPHRRAP